MITHEHLGPVKGIGSHSLKRTARPKELARGNVVSIRPNAVLRIIRKVGTGCARYDRITEIGACWIRCLRNRNAVKEWCCSASELRKQPAVGKLIINNNWVTGILGLTRATESRP